MSASVCNATVEACLNLSWESLFGLTMHTLSCHAAAVIVCLCFHTPEAMHACIYFQRRPLMPWHKLLLDLLLLSEYMHFSAFHDGAL